MIPASVNLDEKLSPFNERWSPRIIARMNDCHVKLTKVQGNSVWHSHPDTHELFLVLRRQLRIDFREGAVSLKAGELLVVPRGVEHQPYAETECHVIFVESTGTENTGDAAKCGLSNGEGEWI